ncbi:porin family protein [Alloalcanivorax mobilis]|uniref:outer membrane beta-barrel protein n=1 Tax=Alloalcanivorax mobilis TaxID=2019569 RepID=UPI000C765495|nr:outer membrane beta-barrel protein [Alloalcanivorax mobilis]
MQRFFMGAACAAIALSTFTSASASSWFQTSAYVAADLGRSDANFSRSDFGAFQATDSGGNTYVFTPSVDDKDVALAFLVGIQPHPNIALDVGYLDLGEASVTYQAAGTGVSAKGEIGVDGMTLGINLLSPSYRQVTLFARGGLFRWSSDTRVRIDGATLASDDDDGTDPFYGVGLLFGWDNLRFRAGVTRYEVEDTDIDVYGGGLQYRFPVGGA